MTGEKGMIEKQKISIVPHKLFTVYRKDAVCEEVFPNCIVSLLCITAPVKHSLHWSFFPLEISPTEISLRNQLSQTKLENLQFLATVSSKDRYDDDSM